MRAAFLAKWVVRDLRRRWLQIAAIALVMGIGAGVYAGLGSTAAWRRQSNDASFEQLAMYDIRVSAAEGADAPAGALVDTLRRLDDPVAVAVAEERLIAPTQVDASAAGETILVPGRVVGMDMADGGPHVNAVSVGTGRGRSLGPEDRGRPVALLERNFASFYDLLAAGTLRLAGGAAVQYVGQALAPEYFIVLTEEGGFFAQANLAVVFTSLETAQALSGKTGRVNDLLIRVRPGVDVEAAADDVARAFAQADPGIGAVVTTRADEDAYRILYDDIEGDQRFWNVFAALILIGASFGTFNLAARMVEAQRREIGIGMALGMTTGRLAVRPLATGAAIAAAGVALAAGVGVAVLWALRPVFVTMLPLPVWHTEFQPWTFLRGAAIAAALPLVATVWPVWRAVRVMPVDTIATTHRTARGGLARALRRFRRPVGAFRRMPLGNVLRTPRRSLLTALGIGAAIATLVAILGMIDSFVATMDRNDSELLKGDSRRVVVSLAAPVDETGPEIDAVRRAPSVGGATPVARFGGSLTGVSGVEFGVSVEALDMANPLWAPTVERGGLNGGAAGIVISAKAAADLGVDVGDRVRLRHPAVTAGGLSTVVSELPVAGIHPAPFRFQAYLDRSQLGPLFGRSGLANELYVVPAAGSTVDDVKRELFGLPGVASVQPVAAAGQIVKDALDEFTAVFRVIEGFILLLALLIAYNASSINADERARERATLFAFGLPARRLVGLEMAEGLLLGIAGTAGGLLLGGAVLRWVTTNTVGTTMPDLDLHASISTATMASAVVLGAVAVAAAPLLTVRRLRRMDIPGTLRVVE